MNIVLGLELRARAFKIRLFSISPTPLILNTPIIGYMLIYWEYLILGGGGFNSRAGYYTKRGALHAEES